MLFFLSLAALRLTFVTMAGDEPPMPEIRIDGNVLNLSTPPARPELTADQYLEEVTRTQETAASVTTTFIMAMTKMQDIATLTNNRYQEKLRAELERQRTDNAGLRANYERLSATAEQLQEDNDTLCKEVESSAKELTKLQDRLAVANETVNEARLAIGRVENITDAKHEKVSAPTYVKYTMTR